LAAISIRPATEADAPHVALCIQLAESQGTGAVSYARLFDLSDEETDTLLLGLAAEEADGQELTFENFLLIEVNGQVAGGCAAWIEAHDCPPSNSVKATLLTHYLRLERFRAAATKLQALNTIAIERKPGVLQIDSIAVFDGFRGQGLVAQLIEAQLRRFARSATEAQIICMDTNAAAIRAYQKAGFHLEAQTQCEDPHAVSLLTDILGGTGKRSFRKDLP